MKLLIYKATITFNGVNLFSCFWDRRLSISSMVAPRYELPDTGAIHIELTLFF